MSAPGEEGVVVDEGTGMMPMAGTTRDYTGGVVQMAWYQPRMKYPAGIKADTVPGPRAAHSCNLIGSTLYVFGGWNGKCGLNDLHALNVESMEWSVPVCHGTVPSTRNNHATFVYGAKLYIHGGHDGVKWLADLHCLDTETLTFSTPAVSGVVPSARACHTTTLLGRKVFCYGGYDGSRCFNELDMLDLDTMTWLQPRVSGTIPQARNAQTMTVVGSKLFLFGGHSGNKHLRDLHVLDSETLTWSQPEMKGILPPGLRGHTANLIGDKIFLFGGYDGRGRSNDLYLLNTKDFRWEHPVANESTPAGRQRHTACLVASKKLFVMGGFDGFKWLNDLHVLDVGKLEESAITSASVTSLLDDLRHLVNNPAMFPDVTFMVEGEPVVAHRAVLCARSEHFRAMFASGMRESREAVIPYGAGWSRAAFVAMMEFLYTGSVRDLSPVIAADLMGLADHSAIDGLKALCETALMHSVDTSNVCTLLVTAHRCTAPELKRFCMEFIYKNPEAVPLHELATEPTLLLDITKEALARK